MQLDTTDGDVEKEETASRAAKKITKKKGGEKNAAARFAKRIYSDKEQQMRLQVTCNQVEYTS